MIRPVLLLSLSFLIASNNEREFDGPGNDSNISVEPQKMSNGVSDQNLLEAHQERIELFQNEMHKINTDANSKVMRVLNKNFPKQLDLKQNTKRERPFDPESLDLRIRPNSPRKISNTRSLNNGQLKSDIPTNDHLRTKYFNQIIPDQTRNRSHVDNNLKKNLNLADIAHIVGTQEKREVSGTKVESAQSFHRLTLTRDQRDWPIIAILCNYANDGTAELQETLIDLEYDPVSVNSVEEAIEIDADAIIAGYGGGCDGDEVSNISSWIESGKGYIQNGDHFNWFPNAWENVGLDTVEIVLNDLGHPVTAGLPETFHSYGFWHYNGWGYFAYVTDTTFTDIAAVNNNARGITADQIGDGRAVYLGFNIFGPDASSEVIQLLSNTLQYVTNTDDQDESQMAQATVVDHLGNPNDSATVYFFSTEWDTVIPVATDSLGTASAELGIGMWSTYAHNNTDNGTYLDLWDGGVFYVTPDGVSQDNIQMVLHPREDYGFLIAGVEEYNEQDSLVPVMTSVTIYDSTGSSIYYGATNVWGDIGTVLDPYQEYDVSVYYDGEFHTQSISIDTVDAYRYLSFEFGDGGDDEDSTSGGVEFHFTSVDSMYAAYGSVFTTMGSDCDECAGNLSDMTPDTSVIIRSQSDFESWSSYYGFNAYYFQFIDANDNGVHDIGEVYAVSCEEAEWDGGNVTVAYNGNAYYLDFVDFWDQAYGFDWEGGDDNDDDNDDDPNGFYYMGEFEGHHYYASLDTFSWHEAHYFTDTVETGEGTEAYLATITSSAENNFILSSIDTLNSGGVWIGLTDEQEEGNWQWVTGEEVVYTNWNDGEPNNSGGNEHYAELRMNGGVWNDLPNDFQRSFIIELEINDVDDSSSVYFFKEDYADFTDPDNWDHITEAVAITRADNQGLFNPYAEDSYNGNGPVGTLWSPMPTDQSTTADYVEWVEAVNYSPPSVLGQTISLWCVEENIFYDIQMESWTAGNNGGGFSYWRYPAEAPQEPGMILVWTGVGNDSTGDGSFDSPFATIGHAVNEMDDGDMIIVGPGVYNENISASNTSGMLFSFAGPDSTVINGNGQGTIFEIIQGDWLVRGFAFTNGSADVNGGALYINNGTIMMGNNIFVSNTAESEGGALFATNSNVVIDSCMFMNNSTNNFDGGAMKVSSYDSLSNRFVSISNTLFMGNSARAGAGAYIGASNGAYMDVYMDSVTFVQNSGEYNVGLRVRGNTYTSVYNSAFIGNESQGYAAGGGFSQGSGGYMDHCLIVNNHANLAGGNANSGGFSVWSGSNVYFNFCTFAGNIAAYGSALSVGGGSYADVHGSIVWGNPGQNSLAAVQWDNNGSGLHLHETTVQGGENGVFTDTLSYAEYSNVMSSPPFFCEPANGNFSIDEMSPAVTSWGEPMGALGYGCTGTIQADATILGIEDIPNDQGGRVYITFERSIFDTDGLGRTEMYTIERLDGDQWVGLNSVGAYASNVYVVEATTLADSTSENDAMTTYRVVANMDEGNFESEPSSGYSVDNIFPGMLTGLNAVLLDGVVNLNWEMSDANDLSHYNVYRSDLPEFNIEETYFIGESNDPVYSDDITELGQYYYMVTAVDIHENEGDPSEVVNIELLSLEDIHGLPEDFAIHQNYPNPFNPTTTLRYDTPESGTVSILIYDMMGRQIRTLVNENVSAGYHFVQWDGTNETGSPVAAGVYIYSLNSGSFRGIKKMILLK